MFFNENLANVKIQKEKNKTPQYFLENRLFMPIIHQNRPKKRNQRNQHRRHAHTLTYVAYESLNVGTAIGVFWINFLFHFLLVENMGCAKFDPRLNEFAVIFERFDTYIYVQKKHGRKNAPNNRN
jgi:hypothetical protein